MPILRALILLTSAGLLCLAQKVTINVTKQDMPLEDAIHTVNIGGTVLRLGMSRSEALSNLSRRYVVTQSQMFSGQWLIGTSKDSVEDVGAISFDDHDKLVLITNNLGESTDAEGARAFNDLFRVIEAMQPVKDRPVIVNIQAYGPPSFTVNHTEHRIREILIDTLDGKRLEIDISDSIGSGTGSQISVQEILMKPRK